MLISKLLTIVLLFPVSMGAEGPSLREQTAALKYERIQEVPKDYRFLPTPRTTHILLVSLDVASTCWALDEGFTEMNPFLGGQDATCERVALTNAAFMGVALYLMRDLPNETTYWTRTKRKIWRRVNMVRGAALAWNAYQLK